SGYLIVGGNHLQQALVNDVRGQREHQKPGVERGKGQLKPAVAPVDGGEHRGVVAQGLLNGGLQVLDEHSGGAHVRLPQGKVRLPVEEALSGEYVLQRLVRRGAVRTVNSIDAVVGEGLGQNLGKQKVQA